MVQNYFYKLSYDEKAFDKLYKYFVVFELQSVS